MIVMLILCDLGCQDTGTAIIMGKRGQRVWTDGQDEAHLSRGVYNAYTTTNLRYSQVLLHHCPMMLSQRHTISARSRPSTCFKRKTPAPTSQRRSTFTPPTATSTTFRFQLLIPIRACNSTDDVNIVHCQGRWLSKQDLPVPTDKGM